MIPILSTDLSNVDVSRPLIDQTQTDFTISGVEVKQSDKDPSQYSLVITLVTNYTTKSTKAQELKPGFKIIDRILLTPTGGMTQEMVEQSLKKFMLACGRTSGAFGDPASYVSTVVTAKVLVEEDKTGKYDAQNRLRYVAKA